MAKVSLAPIAATGGNEAGTIQVSDTRPTPAVRPVTIIPPRVSSIAATTSINLSSHLSSGTALLASGQVSRVWT